MTTKDPHRIRIRVLGEQNAQALFDCFAGQYRHVTMGRGFGQWWIVSMALHPRESEEDLLTHCRSLFPRVRMYLAAQTNGRDKGG